MTLRYQPASLLPVLVPTTPIAGDWWRVVGGDKVAAARVTASASDGIRLALQSIGGVGRVVAPAYTCDRVIAAVRSAGDQPILVDVDPANGSYVREHLLHSLSIRPKAILLTHLFGIDVDASWLLELAATIGVPVIEDASLLLDLRGHGLKPSFSVFSFGRGKPLGLGGGGALLVRDASFANHPQTIVPDDAEQPRFGRVRLGVGAVRDGVLALWLASLSARVCRPATPYKRNSLPLEPLKPMTPSLNASRSIAFRIRLTDITLLEQAARGALECYLDAFVASGVQCGQPVGRRLPSGTVSPVLALLSDERDQLISELAKVGVDCPRYWTYSVAERMGLSGYVGAKKLSRTLLFLPLHRRIDGKVAHRIANVLSRRELSAFS